MVNINKRLIPEQMDVYSTNEVKTNKIWKNGKPIYRKIVSLGTLNNSSSKTVTHGIPDIDEFKSVQELATNGTTWIKSGFNDEIYWSASTLTWNTKVNRSSYTGFVILEYTKTTDSIS